MTLELLENRARVMRGIRNFFNKRNYLEVDTPLLSPDLIPETSLEVFETARLAPPGSRGKNQAYWLIPSPEIWMKKLIAEHRTSLYQICKCFRNGESSGRLHSPEFTMLEYYTMNAGYKDSLKITEDLFACLGEFQNSPSVFRLPFQRVTIAEAFSRWAGFDLFKTAEQGALAGESRRLGLDPPRDLDTAALYDLIFIHAVEDRLPKDKLVALMDYPAFVPCLAKKNADGGTVERWELYYGGIELANCYTEETDPEEVKNYFAAEGKAKNKKAIVRHAIDGGYWKIFSPRKDQDNITRPFPACSGVALGVDRLIMALCGKSAIDGTLPFPFE
jgi:lysyl-tRNA synthetase class 2